jgi:hypothetical protein
VHEFRERCAAFPEGYIRKGTAPFAIRCVPALPNCGTAVRTGKCVLCGGSPVGLRSISATVVTIKVLVLLQVFGRVHGAAVV